MVVLGTIIHEFIDGKRVLSSNISASSRSRAALVDPRAKHEDDGVLIR
jgi:hypothetical protein